MPPRCVPQQTDCSGPEPEQANPVGCLRQGVIASREGGICVCAVKGAVLNTLKEASHQRNENRREADNNEQGCRGAVTPPEKPPTYGQENVGNP